jgi:hypothetical protein
MLTENHKTIETSNLQSLIEILYERHLNIHILFLLFSQIY